MAAPKSTYLLPATELPSRLAAVIESEEDPPPKIARQIAARLPRRLQLLREMREAHLKAGGDFFDDRT